MAKRSKPTNAFGIDPNSFKTIQNKTHEEETLPVSSPLIPEEKPEPVVEIAQGKAPARKQDPNRERKTCHIHFLMKESLLEKVDGYAKKVNKSRAAVIELALKAYLIEHGE